jgi:hypothetical protein
MLYSEPYKGEIMNSMNKAKAKIIQAWEENPLTVITVGALAATATAKVINAVTAASNSRTWKKEVNRRDMNSRRIH